MSDFDVLEYAYADETATVLDPDAALRGEFGGRYAFARMRVTADGSKVGEFEYGRCLDCHAMVEFRRASLRKHLDHHARIHARITKMLVSLTRREGR